MVFSLFTSKKASAPTGHKAGSSSRALFHMLSSASWGERGYRAASREGYMKNVIAYRSIQTVMQAAGSVAVRCCVTDEDGVSHRTTKHPLLTLWNAPSPIVTGTVLMQDIVASLLIGGNAFIYVSQPKEEGSLPQEIHVLRQDAVQIIAGTGHMPEAYIYKPEHSEAVRFPVNRLNGHSAVIHIKMYHPLNHRSGFAPAEAAASAIDQHNQAADWNQALLQNGARPSGALVVKANEHHDGFLPDEQYQRLREQMESHYTGSDNAGRPFILEGGLDWREMSISPRDMEFLDAKHSAARDIALAFGVPPQLLGVPGDNTYSNLAEARVALWEQTVIPTVEHILETISARLSAYYPHTSVLIPDMDHVAALSPRRDALWERVGRADFLSTEEKRSILGI